MASHFTESTISIPTAAKARAARLQAAAAANPDFSLDANGVQFSFIETALYLSIFGNLVDGNANTEWVKVLFGKFLSRPLDHRCHMRLTRISEQERLPFQEGFARSEAPVTAAGILSLVSKVAAASA